MTKIILQGAGGRMGKVVAALVAAHKSCRIVAGVDVSNHTLDFPTYSALADVREDADVLIDFSHPSATENMLPFCAEHRLPCVVCTTGLPESTLALMLDASAQTAVFHSANMSLGINLLAALVKKAQKALPDFDIEIIEKHHHHKLDAPSGTALLLADAINRQANGCYQYVHERHSRREARKKDEIGIHAVRGGSIVGEHDVLFAGPDETITLSHSAFSRDVFANGAISAALFLAGKSAGMYSMQDLFGDTI